MVIDDGSTTDAGIWDAYVDEDWLGRQREEILEPARPIVDPHHHLWWDTPVRYRFEDLLADLGSGHAVHTTVYMEAGAMYRADGPEHLRAVGETEYANGIAAMSASGQFGPTRVCGGIVGHCDLRAGDASEELLQSHIAAGNGRFRGVRVNAYHDEYVRMGDVPPKGLLLDREFRRGFARLAPLGLVADAMCLHTQLLELADLAATFPDTPIVVNHVGGPTRVGPYASRLDAVTADWSAGMRALARCPNVVVKLGGLVMPLNGFGFHKREQPIGSVELAEATRDWYLHTIECFGVARCMFESNFPVDKASVSYRVLWNSFKRIAAGFSAAERAALFHDTAVRVYRLG
jgi:predicted TIM-barrel fold metal-dependent hydrolase